MVHLFAEGAREWTAAALAHAHACRVGQARDRGAPISPFCDSPSLAATGNPGSDISPLQRLDEHMPMSSMGCDPSLAAHRIAIAPAARRLG
jgi:hypothetical protein